MLETFKLTLQLPPRAVAPGDRALPAALGDWSWSKGWARGTLSLGSCSGASPTLGLSPGRAWGRPARTRGPPCLAPTSGRPGPRPSFPHLCLPLGHAKPIPVKKEVSGPKGAADTRSGRAPDTCEARHLRRANRGPPGLPRAHPLGAGGCAAARTSVPARPASYRRARRLLISVAPAPPPPPAAAVTAVAAGGRDTTSSGLHRHVRRAANCIVGGKGWGGGGERGRERGGPAEGRGPREKVG